MLTILRVENNLVQEVDDLPVGLQTYSLAELFHPALLWMDATNISPRPQPGWTAAEAAGVWTFAPPPPPPPPSPAQLAAAALAGGLTVTSASTPAINAIYPTDIATTGRIQAEMLAIIATGAFADQGSTLDWPDIGGQMHTFPSTDSFKAFAVAMAMFVANCAKAARGTVPLPATAVGIP